MSTSDARRQAPLSVQRFARTVHNGAVRMRNLGNRAISGDKPLIVGFVLAFAAAIVLLSGPMQSYLASSDRVELLEAQRDALAVANSSLSQQADDLNDPAQLELRAREDGYVRPGEVPYVVVPPEVERPQITDPAPVVEPSSGPWYSRMWRGLTSIFSG